ncbi:MAG: cytochrome c family protein [Roseiarcus sp.]|jgi:cytochrome c
MQPTKAVIVVLAALVALLGAMALGCFSDAAFALDRTVGPGDGPFVGAKAAAAPEPPLAALLAKADAAAGEAGARPCRACHSFERGAFAKVGPPLYGVVGRPVASIAGFRYSAGMKALGGQWTYYKLERLLADPSAFVAGTRMSFPGEPDAQRRADILAYLRTLSDSPVPFPE